MAKILVGCRLPHGLVLQHPQSKKLVTIAGMNSSRIIGATHVTTEVDAEFWAAWKAEYASYPALKAGSIFEASSVNVAADKAKELKDEKTGFEPMAQDAGGVTPSKE